MDKKERAFIEPDNGKPNFIKIEKEAISYGFRIVHKKEDDIWITHIPAYNIMFSSPTREDAGKRADIMVWHFYDHYIKKEGWKKFIIAIHKLGFHAPNHATAMNRLLNDTRPPKTNFKFEPKINIDVFEESEVVSEDRVMQLAV